nr:MULTISPECIES: ORF6N domain-containing protein [unclassified Treponema]
MAKLQKEPVPVNQKIIKEKIYTIRGQKVMLDLHLAEIYGYETKTFNQQVKRNIEKFEDDFMFQLTDEEVQILSRSHFVTLNKITSILKIDDAVLYHPMFDELLLNPALKI